MQFVLTFSCTWIRKAIDKVSNSSAIHFNIFLQSPLVEQQIAQIAFSLFGQRPRSLRLARKNKSVKLVNSFTSISIFILLIFFSSEFAFSIKGDNFLWQAMSY